MSRRKYSFETGEKYEFGVWDYILFSLTLLISALIGLFYAIKDRKVKNTQTFFLAGGNMGVFPVALSLLVSFISAITILGTPAEMYNYTTVYAWIGLGYCITIAGAAHVYIPVFYNLKLTSVYEYLEMRFCRGMRTSVSLVYIFFMLMYMSIVLYGPSLALNAVTGFTLWGAVVSVGLVCTFYTALGGMKAVLWSDTFQSFMIIGGLLAVLIRGCIETDGLAEAWKIAEDNQRIRHMDTRVDPTVRHSFWALVLGGGFVWLAIYGINQAQVQRACSCPTLKKAQIALWCNFPGLCVILYLCCLIGIVLYAFYSRCDPKTFGLITASDQLLPLFVMDVMGHLSGFPGIFLACIFSGSLSTISSGLNSLSAVLLHDFIKPFLFKKITEERATITSKILAFCLGMVCLALTYVASLMGGILQAALSLFGALSGPILGVFTLGIIFPWANHWGAYSGFFGSLVLMVWVAVGKYVTKSIAEVSPIHTDGCNWDLLGKNFTRENLTEAVEQTGIERFYQLSYLWFSLTAVLVVLAIGLPVSFLTGPNDPRMMNPRLICPIFDIACPCLPERIRRPLRFGVDHQRDSSNKSTPSHLSLEKTAIQTSAEKDLEPPKAAADTAL